MRVKIFNRGKGWYIICNNYKDENDKAYLDLFFPQKTEPKFVPNDRGFSVKDIDIIEGKFTSYFKKAGLTVFKYAEIEPNEVYVEPEYEDIKKDDNNVVIEESELPFY